jgi:CBS domain-containing protein
MKMLREHLHRLLVLDADDRCVGIVTTSDLLGLLVDEGR